MVELTKIEYRNDDGKVLGTIACLLDDDGEKSVVAHSVNGYAITMPGSMIKNFMPARQWLTAQHDDIETQRRDAAQAYVTAFKAFIDHTSAHNMMYTPESTVLQNERMVHKSRLVLLCNGVAALAETYYRNLPDFKNLYKQD